MWFEGNVTEAIALSKSEGKLFLVLIEGKNLSVV